MASCCARQRGRSRSAARPFEARWQQLASFPSSGAPRDDIAPGIRHLVVGDYLTLYRVNDDVIEILRVLHGRRNIEADDLGS
ncbi:type II toxin-antitoxin system RelE/ParE family toxin [Mesorhizobium sp. B2-4-19]|uniref:type II toxin-antitoxin system RelE/ParE family toxin n=1 Tax=Mesorhizobium sp. B2-4-19 TaxID=2589930 RepID=UPI0032B23EF4